MQGRLAEGSDGDGRPAAHAATLGRLSWPPLCSADVARRAGWFLLAIVAVAYVALYLRLPIALEADAGYDDAWFADRAQSLIQGHWFGPYSHITLIKGPGYPFFLALNHMLGGPVTLLQALLQVLASALMGWATLRLSGRRALAAAVFLACLWHPYLFPPTLGRDSIYGAQTLLFLACALHMLAPGRARPRLLWAAASGLSFVWFWLTREEGIWIAPALGVLCLAGLWPDRRAVWDLAVAAGVAAAVMALVALGNFAAYRTWSIVEFQGGPYAKAVNALQSVRVGDPVPYVPVPAKVRQAVYKVSPAFAFLEPFLEGGEGKGWTKPGCGIYPDTCGDYAGGWFMWALRDAVNWRGLYHRPADANRFYAELAKDVQAACRDGRLTCRRGLISYMPAITASQWRTLPAKLKQLADFLLVKTPPEDRPASSGSVEQIQAMWDFEGYPRRTPGVGDRPFKAAGWFYAPPKVWLQTRCTAADSGSVIASVQRQASPDIAGYFHDPAAADRQFLLDLPDDLTCVLQSIGAGPADGALSLAPPYRGPHATLAGHPLYFDSRQDAADTPSTQNALKALAGLAALYATLVPMLLIAAAASYLVHLVLLARGVLRLDFYWWTTHALWLAAACRCLVLLLVDLSSFPGLTTPYLAPAFPLTLIAALLTLVLPWRSPRQKPIVP